MARRVITIEKSEPNKHSDAWNQPMESRPKDRRLLSDLFDHLAHHESATSAIRRRGRAAERPMTPYDFRHLGIIHDLESMIARLLKCGNFGHALADLSVRIGHSCIAFTLAAYVGTAAFLMP
jgi:integrase